MKSYSIFWLKAAPFTFGMALTLISLCYLVVFYENGMYFEEADIWLFALFFSAGFPTLIFGIKSLGSDKPDSRF